MGKDKLKRFAENKTFINLIQPSSKELFDLKGNWGSIFFKNNHPIVLELGCGKGEYALALARKYPDKNFIGIDIKGARLWRGAKSALEESLKNVAFLRTRIEWIEFFFESKEINEIWIPFPDPQIKYKREKKRLTHPYFLKKYHSILKPEGLVHLKTDSEFLYGYTQATLSAYGHKVLLSAHDVYSEDIIHLPDEVKDIKTFYEQQFIKCGKKVAYLGFSLSC